MGLSETILAAIIGALATMGTAIFQLVRNRAPSETRPKKNRVRSTFAIVLLVVGAMVGGYFWSELRAVGAKEEIAALRADLKLAAREAAVTAAEATVSPSSDPTTPDSSVTPARLADAGTAESVAHLPPCRVTAQAEDAGPTACTDSLATTVAVCAIVPAAARTAAVRVQARVPRSETPWLERNAGAATLGDLHIAAAHAEYPASVDKRSVCLDVANWSVEDTLAVRILVDYDLGPSPTSELTAAAPSGTTL
jgi:hypothetical protein